jgi:hypothetical protein
MLKSRWFIMVLASAFFASLAVHGNSALAGDTNAPILKEKKSLRRALKHELVPYRLLMGILKTGQVTPYADGDDGDLEKGVPWPKPRFVDHGNGTVTDRVSGLMWTKDARQIPEKMNWHDALTACNNCDYAGYDNWRLPNVREMLSLVDFGACAPALPRGHPFVNAQPSDLFWSSTTSLPDTARAWCIGIMSGILSRNDKASCLHHVWPVRRGTHHVW